MLNWWIWEYWTAIDKDTAAALTALSFSDQEASNLYKTTFPLLDITILGEIDRTYYLAPLRFTLKRTREQFKNNKKEQEKKIKIRFSSTGKFYVIGAFSILIFQFKVD